MQMGRKILYTDVPEITYENVIEVVRKALPGHEANATDIDELVRFERGEQERTRIKTYRSDIDNWCADNIANEATEFWLGFLWSNPITLVQSDELGEAREEVIEGISLLNRGYRAEKIKKKNQQLGDNVEIGALGYTHISTNEEWQEGDSYFKLEVLEPQTAFIIRSGYYIDRRPMLGVTYRKDSHGNRFFTCYSKDRRYEIKNLLEIQNGEIVPGGKSTWGHDLRSGEENPLHMIPIVEWIRSYDRMGLFERQMPEMNNLNLLISDFTNDVDQNTQAIWHSNDVDFETRVVKNGDGIEEEVTIKPSSGDLVQTQTTRDGKTPFIKALAINYDYPGMLNNIVTRRALILQKMNVPQRNDNSGGSTGVAMSDATGWSAAEMAASKQQNIMEDCKMEEVRVVLAAIKNSRFIEPDNPLLKLTVSDIQANTNRQKTYELTVKTNAICALLAKGFDLDDTLTIAPLFADPNQVSVRSGEGVRRYQEANVFKSTSSTSDNSESEEKRPFPDYSDQEGNSPNIGGMETNQELVK